MGSSPKGLKIKRSPILKEIRNTWDLIKVDYWAVGLARALGQGQFHRISLDIWHQPNLPYRRRVSRFIHDTDLWIWSCKRIQTKPPRNSLFGQKWILMHWREGPQDLSSLAYWTGVPILNLWQHRINTGIRIMVLKIELMSLIPRDKHRQLDMDIEVFPLRSPSWNLRKRQCK